MSVTLSTDYSPITRQTRHEDRINSLLHGLGLLVAVAAAAVLISLAGMYGTAWHVVSFSIYGASLIALYGVSTLYHGLPGGGRGKAVLQIVDHASIYVFIAGTYTPFTLVSLQGGWGWSLFGVVWGLAVAGVAVKPFVADRYDVFSTLIYLAMGWIGVVAIVPLVNHLALGGLVWLMTGGLIYTVGALFYLWQSLPYNHALWHVMVLGGSACHYVAILFFVLELA